MTTLLWAREKGPLTVRVEHEWPNLFLWASGEVTIESAELLKQELRGAFHSAASSIVLDLDQVEYADSTGYQVLLWAARRSRESGERLRIRCESRAVRGIVQVLGIEGALPLMRASQ